MNTPEEKDVLLAPLRELPVEVSLPEVERMVAAFPLAMGITAWLAHLAKFNLNTIIMTSAGTLLLSTGIILLAGQAPAESARQRPEPAPVIAPAPQPPALAELRAIAPMDEVPAAIPAVPTLPSRDPAPLDAPAPLASLPVAPTPAAPTALAPQPPARPGPAKAQTAERDFNLSGFTSIVLNSSLDVVVEQGPFSVTAAGPQDLLDKLELKTEGNLLVVGLQSGKVSMAKNRQPTVMVRLPRLEQLIVQGSGDIAVAPFTDATRLELIVMGSGSIALDGAGNMANLAITVAGSGDVACEQLDVKEEVVITVTGSGDVHVVGRTDQLEVNLVGSGDVHASGLKANTGHVNLAGSGDVFVADVANMQLSKLGSGDLHVGGSTEGEQSEDDGHND